MARSTRNGAATLTPVSTTAQEALAIGFDVSADGALGKPLGGPPKALKDAKAKGKLIDDALKSVTTTAELVHAAAYHALEHLMNHGDKTLFSRLIHGLTGTPINVRGLLYAVERFTPVTVNMRSLTASGGGVEVHKDTSERGKRILKQRKELWALDGFWSNPFWNLPAVRMEQSRVLGFDQNTLVRVALQQEERFKRALEAGKVPAEEAKDLAHKFDVILKLFPADDVNALRDEIEANKAKQEENRLAKVEEMRQLGAAA